jgi:hypothetical protein
MCAYISLRDTCRSGNAPFAASDPATWERMVRLYKACPQDSTTEPCEAAMAVRTGALKGPICLEVAAGRAMTGGRAPGC